MSQKAFPGFAVTIRKKFSFEKFQAFPLHPFSTVLSTKGAPV